jgi:hypothetical protein
MPPRLVLEQLIVRLAARPQTVPSPSGRGR